MTTVNYKDQAYRLIKDKIIKLELIPGQKISRKDFATMVKIGDTPVREAILQLKREGLLEVKPQSGTSIAKINMLQVREAKFVRKTLETAIFIEAAEVITPAQIKELEQLVAVQRIHLDSADSDYFFELDEDFHKFFYAITNKTNVYQWIQTLNVHLNRYRHLTLEIKNIKWQKIVEHHENIVAAVKACDTVEITNLLATHLDLVDENYNYVVNEFPDYFE